MNLKTFGRYDKNIFLKHFATQALVQHCYNEKIGKFLKFDHNYNEQLYLFHGKEILELATFFLGMSTIPCMSLVKFFVLMDFDWPLVISSTSIPIFNPFIPLVFELNVPLH
jgi:hypothetical protein